MVSSLRKMDLISIVNDLRAPKAVKEEALAELRRIERLEGLKPGQLYPAYNSFSRNPSEIARMEEEAP